MVIQKVSGNLLGAARAESDRTMLEHAFCETPDFRALTSTNDFNFVVGRRGAGKSALQIKVYEHCRGQKKDFLYVNKPKEYECLEFQSVLDRLAKDYRTVRAITRVTWRANLLITILSELTGHYKFQRCEDRSFLSNYAEKNETLLTCDCFKRCIEIVKAFSSQVLQTNEIPGAIAAGLEIEALHHAVHKALATVNRAAVFFFDGLDEGWYPDQNATGIIGGLAAAASDFMDSQSEIHVILFIRDNIFRALGAYDPDFSRHIEGNTLRLRWDEFSLFHFAAARLRVSLGLANIENDTKVWNRFAHKGISDRHGFKKCLRYTLFRPRDLLVLLNTAFASASRSGRQVIIEEDIEAASRQMSRDRLSDLMKEYDEVFPGLDLFMNIFQGQPAFQSFGNVVSLLENEIDINSYESQSASDFALLGSGKEAFFALYSVGFLGLEDPSTQNLIFCHDGSHANLDAISDAQKTCIHPCYWKALDIQAEEMQDTLLNEIHDEYSVKQNPDVRDLRMKRVGQLVTELPQMPFGEEGAQHLEDWVFRTIKILFAGQLCNPELKPNKGAIQRRDIVATNMAGKGFWKRVREDYCSRQVIFEVKNYAILKPEDFRQVLSYTGGDYGNFAVIVTRSENEGVNETEKGWLRTMWHEHGRLMLILPAKILARCITKLRHTSRFDYTDDCLNKRLDTSVRSYLSIKHEQKSRKGSNC